MRNRIISILLCLCMALSLLPTFALAADTVTLNVADGKIQIAQNSYFVGDVERPHTGDYIIEGSSDTNSISITGPLAGTVTLNNVSINMDSDADRPLQLANGAKVQVTGTVTLANNDREAIYSFGAGTGIHVAEGASLLAANNSPREATVIVTQELAITGGGSFTAKSAHGTVVNATSNSASFDASAFTGDLALYTQATASFPPP